MYDYLIGRLVHTSLGEGPDEVVLDNAGVGYQVLVSGATLGRLTLGDEATLFVHDMVRDERQVLFGFASREERHLFRNLLGVNKVGPTTALALLSAMGPGALAAAVNDGDTALLARVKGVGKRTAERLCVDLKGRLDDILTLPGRVTDARASVAAALAALGFTRAAAERAAEAACTDAPSDLPLEALVKRALASQRAGGRKAQEQTGPTA